MTNNKTTKRALFSSVVALLLCFTMLLGTTYAWFTDTVTNGVNKIVSGNLDIELWHTPSYKTTWGHGHDETNATEVDANTLLFLNNEDKAIRWEPGAGAAETFRIKNVGNLALKYMFTIATANATETPEGKDLTDILSVQIIEMQLLETGAPAQVPGGVYYQDFLGNGYVMEGELLPGETVDYFVAIDWIPSDRDNEFNVEGGLSIDLGITLLATQFTYEKDATGDQYDVNAEYPEVALPPITTLDELKAALAAGGNFVLGADITYPDTLEVPAGTNISIDMNGFDFIADSTESALIIRGNATLINSSNEPSKIDVQSAPAGEEATSDTTQGIEVKRTGTLNIEDGIIEIGGNGLGVGIINYGKINMNGGKIIVNTSFDVERGVGYGIINYDGTAAFKMTNGEIIVAGNYAYGILCMNLTYGDNDNYIDLLGGKITVTGDNSIGVAIQSSGSLNITLADEFQFDVVNGSMKYGTHDTVALDIYVNGNLID